MHATWFTISISFTEEAGLVITLHNYIQEAFSTNNNWDTHHYYCFFFRGFHQFLRVDTRIELRLGHDRFLPNPYNSSLYTFTLNISL
jgi:hypothetical protein